GGGGEGDDGAVAGGDVARIGAVAPVAQAIGEATRDGGPGLAGLQHETIGRCDQRVVGQALQQLAIFQRGMGTNAGRAGKTQGEIADRTGAGIGQLDAVTKWGAVRGGGPGGDEGEGNSHRKSRSGSDAGDAPRANWSSVTASLP